MKEETKDKILDNLLSFAMWCEEQSYTFRKPKYTAEKRDRKDALRLAKKILIVIAVLLVCFFIIYSKVNVTYVLCGNEHDTVVGFSTNVEEIVEKSKFTLSKNDELILNYFDESENRNTIFIATKSSAKIYLDGELYKAVEVAGTVGDAIKSAGITLGEKDKVNNSLSCIVSNDMEIKIDKAFKVTIIVDGKKQTVYTPINTTGSILSSAGISFDENDILKPNADEIVSGKGKIILKRVTTKEKTKTVKVSFETVTEYSDEMFIDQTKTKVKGKDGKVKQYITETYTDGKLTDSKITKTKTITEKVDRVILKGTKYRPLKTVNGTRVFSELTPPFIIELDETNRPKTYLKRITGTATAYCGGGITSTGQKAMPGRVAVNPRQIPYGTKMYIVSSDGRYCYGYAVASDTGGFARQGSATVDLYMHSYNDCIQFGRRSVDIYILQWG